MSEVRSTVRTSGNAGLNELATLAAHYQLTPYPLEIAREPPDHAKHVLHGCPEAGDGEVLCGVGRGVVPRSLSPVCRYHADRNAEPAERLMIRTT